MLDELNKLIQEELKDLPLYRREVSTTGGNLAWIRKAVKNREGLSERLKELLNTEINKLNR